jgi:hypothetical protein
LIIKAIILIIFKLFAASCGEYTLCFGSIKKFGAKGGG